MTNRASPLVIVPFVLLSLAFLLNATQAANPAQVTRKVTVGDFQFAPAQITINVGDSVQWVNEGGLHNVNADDGSFRSGDPSADPWTYTFTFITPGTYRYFCQIHGAPGGVGMSGTITVQGDPLVLDQFVYLPALLN